MEYVKAKIMSMQDIWAIDKKILRASEPDIKINWDSALPSDEQLMDAIMEKQSRYDSPKIPVTITQDLAEAAAKDLETRIQELWGAELVEKPKIEVKQPADYLPRINEINRLTNAQFGYGGLFSSPPGMYHSPFAGTIIIPSRFLVVMQKSDDVRNIGKQTVAEKHDVEEYSWDRAYFESTLAEEITHSLFRQLRGEWKEGFVEVMKALGPEREERVGLWNEVLAQHTKEKLALSDYAPWGLYVVSDKALLVWANRFARRDYVGADALMQRTSLANVALVDDVMPEEQGARVKFDFYMEHPKNYDKEGKFRAALNRR